MNYKWNASGNESEHHAYNCQSFLTARPQNPAGHSLTCPPPRAFISRLVEAGENGRHGPDAPLVWGVSGSRFLMNDVHPEITSFTSPL